jgi:hypothetical protein
MSFVIVDMATGKKYRKPGHFCDASYDTERGAKNACTRLNKKYSPKNFQPMTHEEYRLNYPVKMVKRVNLMTGKEYMEAEDTPNFCSPASETYWSM